MSDSVITIRDGKVTVVTGEQKTVFAATPKDAATYVALLHDEIERLRNQLATQRRAILESMSRAGVNCGQHYGCCLARRMLDQGG